MRQRPTGQVIGARTAPFAWDPAATDLGPVESLNRERVTQCALSRVCGSCGRPLGRPVAFVGTPQEVGRNAFYAPPLHLECATALLALPGADATWKVLTTSGFEFVRPGRDEVEEHPTFQPNSVV